jgi:hypothetical protein
MSALVTYVQSAVGRVNPVCPGRMYEIVTWLLTVGMWVESHLPWLYAYYSAMQAAVSTLGLINPVCPNCISAVLKNVISYC